MALFYRLFGCICLAVLLTGCGRPSADDLWNDYLERLARLARAEVPAAAPWQRPLWPAARDIRVTTPEWRSGWLRYLDMAGCDLMELVASRNSGLGRVQVPVVRLDYELQFIDTAQRCLDSDAVADNPEMAQWLAEVRAQKQAALPAIYWNTVVGGNELRQFLRQGDVPGTPPLLENGSGNWRALEGLARGAQDLQAPQPPADAGVIPAHLKTLDLNRGGTLIDGLALANRHLPRATALLNGVDTQALCRNGEPSQRARYFHNVLTRVYAGDVQPWLSALWRDSEQLQQALAPLLDSAPQARPAVQEWHQAVFGARGLRQQMKANLEAHTQAWQDLLGACGLMPDAPLA